MIRSWLLVFLLAPAAIAFKFDDSSSCSSESDSDSSEGGHHHHGGGNGGGGNGNRGCEQGWKYFSRPSGGWCIKVFPGEGGRDVAEASCRANGAVLSGLQNQNEVDYILSAGLQVIPTASASLWVGARRTSSCTGVVGITSSCTALTSFEWTDGSTTGTDGFVWTDGQPDNVGNHDQNCVMIITGNTPIIRAANDWPNGKMDDVPCDPGYSVANQPRKVRAWPCGKRPRSSG